MSLPNQNGMDDINQQHIRPPDPHQELYESDQHQQYYGHYEQHQQQAYGPMHHQGYNQQWYPQQQQQQQQQQYQQQQYQYRMPQQEQQFQNPAMYQESQMHHMQPTQMQPVQHPQQPQAQPKATWTTEAPHNVPANKVQPSDEDSSKTDSSPTKKPSKKKAKAKSIKTNRITKVTKHSKTSKKPAKKKSLTKAEIAKYTDTNVLEVAEKLKNGCDCPDNCLATRGFDPEMIYKHRLNIQDLTKAEHDMYLMGQTVACTQPKETEEGKERKKMRAKYRFWGREVCLNAFLYLENTTVYQIKSIRKHIVDHGVAPRSHGNVGKLPHNSFSLEVYQCVTRFLQAYCDKHGIKKKNGVVLLPKDTTFKSMFEECQVQSNEQNMTVPSYTTFRKLFKDQFPNVRMDQNSSKSDSKHSSHHSDHHPSTPSKDQDKSKEKILKIC